MKDEVLKELASRGHRITEVRRFIVEFLATHKKPYDALTLREKLEKKVKKVNKTTVYREIEFLLSEKVLREVDFCDGKKRYEIAGLPHHHHLICEGCDSVEDVMLDNDLVSIEKKIATQSKFKVERHTLEFFGQCAKCISN